MLSSSAPVNCPIHVLAAFNPAGEVIPRYFRFESAEHEQITLEVIKVMTTNEEHFCGLNRILFTCEATANRNAHYYCEIYFLKETSCWILHRGMEMRPSELF